MNADALGVRRRWRHDVAATVIMGRQGSHVLAVKLHWALRIGVALEFIGHGVAGFYRPVAWILSVAMKKFPRVAKSGFPLVAM